MTSEQFVMWLHGYFEIAKPETIDKAQTEIIKKHLDLLFDCKTNPETDMVKEKKLVQMDPLMKGNILKAKNKDTENTNGLKDLLMKENERIILIKK